jgi:hypothetical protein
MVVLSGLSGHNQAMEIGSGCLAHKPDHRGGVMEPLALVDVSLSLLILILPLVGRLGSLVVAVLEQKTVSWLELKALKHCWLLLSTASDSFTLHQDRW